MKTQVIFFIVPILTLSSCQKTILPPEPKANDQWTYRFTTYDESGNVTGTVDKSFTAYGYEQETNKYIKPWVEIKQDGFNDNTGFPCGEYRLEPSGLYIMTTYGVLRTPDPFLPYPGSVGQAFTHYGSGGFESSMTIISTGDTLTVPFGYFSNTYQLQYVNTAGSVDNIWFNDSVWFVKYDLMDSLTSGPGTYLSQSIELVNYISN